MMLEAYEHRASINTYCLCPAPCPAAMFLLLLPSGTQTEVFHCIDLKDILSHACANADCDALAQNPDAWKDRLIDLTALSPGPTAAAWQGSLMRALRHSSAYVRVTFHQIPWALQCLRAFHVRWRFAAGSLPLGR